MKNVAFEYLNGWHVGNNASQVYGYPNPRRDLAELGDDVKGVDSANASAPRIAVGTRHAIFQLLRSTSWYVVGVRVRNINSSITTGLTS